MDNYKSGLVLGAKSNHSFLQKVTGTVGKQKWSLDLAMCHAVIGNLVMNGLLTKGTEELATIIILRDPCAC